MTSRRDGAARAYSFDVFDTALLRRVVAPSDVFRLVAARIAASLQIPRDREFVEDFLVARQKAERDCRARPGKEECTLDEIWELLRSAFPWLPPGVGPDLELDAEAQVICANPRIGEIISARRRRGDRILFISDTYLPQSFVASQLERNGLAMAGDPVYVSSAQGRTKGSGRLFDLVLQLENLEPRNLVHVGDDERSDFAVPKKRGIRASLHRDAKFNRWESAVVLGPDPPRPAGTTLAVAMRSARLHGTGEGRSASAHDLVATFIGPLATLWASWVLGRARQDGVKRLFFAARDGYLAWQAARMLAPAFGDIDCRYLKISRQSIMLPTIEDISPAGIPWLFEPQAEVPELRRLLAKLGFTWPELQDEFRASAWNAGTILATEGEWREFWAVLRRDAVAQRILSRIRERRENTFAYLDQEGCGDGTTFALVDLGWHARVQAALKRLLGPRAAGMRAYYLGLRASRPPASETGPASALFYEVPPDRRRLDGNYAVFERVAILEHVLGLAPHGTITEHRRVGAKLDGVSEPAAAHHVALLGDVVAALAAFVGSCDAGSVSGADEDEARAMVENLLRAWCGTPSASSFDALRNIVVTNDANNLDPRPLLDGWRFREALKNAIPYRLRPASWRNVDEPWWPEVAARRSSRLTALLLLLRRLEDAAHARTLR